MTTSPRVVDFIDSEHVRCIDDMKRNSCYAFTLGNGIFSKSSFKQDIIV